MPETKQARRFLRRFLKRHGGTIALKILKAEANLVAAGKVSYVTALARLAGSRKREAIARNADPSAIWQRSNARQIERALALWGRERTHDEATVLVPEEFREHVFRSVDGPRKARTLIKLPSAIMAGRWQRRMLWNREEYRAVHPKPEKTSVEAEANEVPQGPLAGLKGNAVKRRHAQANFSRVNQLRDLG